jgi:hypothetical protein
LPRSWSSSRPRRTRPSPCRSQGDTRRGSKRRSRPSSRSADATPARLAAVEAELLPGHKDGPAGQRLLRHIPLAGELPRRLLSCAVGRAEDGRGRDPGAERHRVRFHSTTGYYANHGSRTTPIPLTFLGPLPLTSVSAAVTPGSAAVLNSATLAPLSLSQVSSAMVRAVAADSESAARFGLVVPEEARPAIDPTSMVVLLAASAASRDRRLGRAGGGSDNSLRLPQAPEIPGPEARLAVQTARRQAGSRLSGASSGLWRQAGRICPSTLPCAVRPIAA